MTPVDVLAPTAFVQNALYKRWKGFAPPGSCTIIPLRGSSFEDNIHGCAAYIALCPTMRIPEDLTWNRELGGVSSARCAQQIVLAVKQFLEASASPEKWGSMSWDDTVASAVEVRHTHTLQAHAIRS
jgi:hypothetical protein